MIPMGNLHASAYYARGIFPVLVPPVILALVTLPVLVPVWSTTCDIGIGNITSLVSLINFAMDEWFN